MIDPKKIKSNDIMSITTYFKVISTARSVITATDLDGDTGEFKVEGDKLLVKCLSADQSATEKKVSKTDMVEHLVHAGAKPFTVSFTKEDGTERILRGRYVSHETYFGRSRVQDLDITTGDRFRLITHLNLNWLIIDGVKYTVK